MSLPNWAFLIGPPNWASLIGPYLITLADVVYDTGIIDSLLATLVHLFRYGVLLFGVAVGAVWGREVDICRLSEFGGGSGYL